MGKKGINKVLQNLEDDFTNVERAIMTANLQTAERLIRLHEFDTARHTLNLASQVNSGRFANAPDLHAQLHAVNALFLVNGGTGILFEVDQEVEAALVLDPKNALALKIQTELRLKNVVPCELVKR